MNAKEVQSVDDALTFLAETDETMAYHKEHVERANEKKKRTFAVMMSHGKGTIAEREGAAYESQDYTDACDEYFAALRAHEKLKNERTTMVIRIEVWRSKNASKRAGNVT